MGAPEGAPQKTQSRAQVNDKRNPVPLQGFAKEETPCSPSIILST